MSPLDTNAGNTTVLNETLVVTDEVEKVSFTQNLMVLAFTNYTVRVEAFTGAGGGESTDIIVLSPQAGTLCLLILFL